MPTPPTFLDHAVRVRVPATSANLGPGFDALALALARYDEVVAEIRPDGLTIEVDGEGEDTVPRGPEHLVVRAMYAAFDALGGRPTGLAVRCRNQIPQSRGLGSSAAAIVAGISCARALVADSDARLDDESTLDLAHRLEGHPDNVAACLLGGLTVAWLEESRAGSRACAVRVDPEPALHPVVFISPHGLDTRSARAALPDVVPHADAARNAGRAALLIPALTGHPELLLAATEDRLHQDARAQVLGPPAELIRALRADGIPAVLSGAGPVVLAFAPDGAGPDDLARYAPTGTVVEALAVDREGVRVEPFGQERMG